MPPRKTPAAERLAGVEAIRRATFALYGAAVPGLERVLEIADAPSSQVSPDRRARDIDSRPASPHRRSGSPDRADEGQRKTLVSERGLALGARSASASPYRGASPRVSQEVDAVIDTLLGEDAVGGVFRLRDRALEVREVLLYEAELDNGHTAYVCGSPARILPDGVLNQRSGLIGTIRRVLGRQR